MRAPLVRPAPQPDQVARPAPDEPKPAPTRIAGLPRTVDTPSGPKLAFQQGSETDSPGLDDLALAPLPPKRPEDVAVTGALAFVPMPPSRPGSLATGYPLPDLRATLVAAAPDHPLPPPRPGAGARTIALASAGAVTLPPVALPPVAAPAQNPRLDDKARLSALISDAAKPSPPPAAPNARPSASASNAVLAGSPVSISASRRGRRATSRRPASPDRQSSLCRSSDDGGRAQGNQALGPTSANITPCGSLPCTIHMPPGTSIGPLRTSPPASLTRAVAASMSATFT